MRQGVKSVGFLGEDRARFAAGRVHIGAKWEKTKGVQVIARATDVLHALEADPGGLSLAKIAQRVSLGRSTVHRIVTALEAESLVVAASPSGGYRLEPELARFAASAGGKLRESVPLASGSGTRPARRSV